MYVHLAAQKYRKVIPWGNLIKLEVRLRVVMQNETESGHTTMATNLLVSATPKRSLRANFMQKGESISYTEMETVLSPFNSVTRLKMLPG